GSSQAAVTSLIKFLNVEFAVKDLGPLHFFLGIEAVTTPDGLLLSQKRYVTDLLSRTNMLHAKAMPSPMSTSSQLSLFDGANFSDPSLYRSVVGALQYLSLTRPDIAFSVNKVCQFMHKPTDKHWSAVKRILRYLRETTDFGLLLRPSPSFQLSVFSDADWAGSPDDRKSTGGYCVFLGQSLISWSSKKQPTVARSSTESEYKALANATSELLWIKSLLHELGIFSTKCPRLWCDNLGATFLSANPVLHARTKHVEIDYHFVREQVQKRALDVQFLPSESQIADALTKALPTARFQALRTKLCVQPLPLNLRGDNKATMDSATDMPRPPAPDQLL
ncbi:hypothetical protein F2P56_016455, partial [Juglans regia]